MLQNIVLEIVFAQVGIILQKILFHLRSINIFKGRLDKYLGRKGGLK